MSTKKGMERKFHCIKCNEHFAMEWAKNNHEKNCLISKVKLKGSEQVKKR